MIMIYGEVKMGLGEMYTPICAHPMCIRNLGSSARSGIELQLVHKNVATLDEEGPDASNACQEDHRPEVG